MIICAADIHLRPDKPICRKESTEEWIEVQFNKFQYLLDYSTNNNNADIVIAGDLFHKAKGCPEWMFCRLINMLIHHPGLIIAIPGQHDMPFHQLSLLNKSNFGVLQSAGLIVFEKNITGYDLFPWGESMEYQYMGAICVTHQMVIQSPKEEIYPGQLMGGNASTGSGLLVKYSEYSLIVSGDNHMPFYAKVGERYLVNPGSMTRQRSNENHVPGFYVYDTQFGKPTIKREDFPHDSDAVIRITEKKESANAWAGDSSAVDAMLNEIGPDADIDFPSALQAYFLKNNTRKEVQEIIIGGI